jgi:hypothetical protein
VGWRAGLAWAGPGQAALLVAVVRLAGGTVLARVAGDAGAGAVPAVLALPAAFLGGALLLGGPVLGGCAALLVAAVAGALGVADRLPVFVAAATAALLGGLAAAAVALGCAWPGAAAVTAAVVFLFTPLLGPLAARLGRLPMPMLPRTAADLVRDDPEPPRPVVNAAVLRADALLTGMIAGGVAVACGAAAVLATGAGGFALILLGLLTLGFGVRARLYPAVRHRLPILLAAAASAVALVAGWPALHPLPTAVPVLLTAAALAVLAALVYSRRPAGAALARYAEIVEILVVLACVPVVCAVLQLYGLVRGLGG